MPEEASGLQYAAGYVCQAMRKNLGSKDADILECIEEQRDCSNGEDGSGITSDWIKLASRRGLMHVKDSTYRVFLAMELVVRQFFQREAVKTPTENPKHQAIKHDYDIAFH